MSTPTVVIVPGFWLGPRPYDLLVEEMRKAAPALKDFVYAELPSTGKRSPGAPNMADDSMGVRAVIKPLVEAGKRVIVIAHSTGGLIAAGATEDLEVGQKLAVNGGGVERFIFITAGILPVGAPHPPAAWEGKDGETWVADPEEKFYKDVDPAVAEKHCKPFLKCQPLMTEWNGIQKYVGFDKVPSTYILCENDAVIPTTVQEMCAGIAGSDIVRIPHGHLPFLANPKLLAEKVVTALKL